VGKTPLSIAATEVIGQPMKDMSALIRQLFTTLSPSIAQELKQHMAKGTVLPAFIVVCSLVLEAQANEDT